MSQNINGYELNDDFALNSTVYCIIGDELLECEVIRQPMFAPCEFNVYILKVTGEDRELRMMPDQMYRTRKECLEDAIQRLQNAIVCNNDEIEELKETIKSEKETIDKFTTILNNL